MQEGNTYVYFALVGDSFDPDEVTQKIGFAPTDFWRKGDKGKYKSTLDFSSWRLSTAKGKENFDIYKFIFISL
jgi:hypothetical protein